MPKNTKYFNLATPGPEDRTTEWWKDFNLAVAFKQETGNWPSRRHPTLGEWTAVTVNALHGFKDNGLNGKQSGILTELRVMELRRAGYPMDGKIPKDFTKPGKQSLIERVIDMLESGKQPTFGQIENLRTKRLSNDVEKRLHSLGLRL